LWANKSAGHSLATNLRALGVDIKVAQELLRHASCRTTLDIYTRAVSGQKREANSKVVEMMLPTEATKLQHPPEQREAAEWTPEAAQNQQVIGGPGRDRTDDLFHAILTSARNSLKRLDSIRLHKH